MKERRVLKKALEHKGFQEVSRGVDQQSRNAWLPHSMGSGFGGTEEERGVKEETL